MEDKREAAVQAIGVSNQIVAASLAMLAILGAAVAFAMDKERLGIFSGVLLVGSFSAFVASIWAGLKGVANVYKKGHAGTWNYGEGNPHFQFQAVLSLVAMVAFLAGVFLMKRAGPDVENAALSSRVDSLRIEARAAHENAVALQAVVDSIRLAQRRPKVAPRANR